MPQFDPIGQYLTEQLAVYKKALYQVDTGEFWALDPNVNFIKRNGDLPLGANELLMFNRQYFGSASIYDGKASDIPIVSYMNRMGKVPAIIIIDGAEWNTFDLKQEALANSAGRGVPRQSLTNINYLAMADFITRREHYLTLYGEESRSIFGLYNQPGITKLDYAVTNIYDTATVTPAMIYALFIGWIGVFMSQSLNSNSGQIEIKIPERLMTRLSEPFSATSPNITVFQMLTDSTKGRSVGSITSAIEGEGQNLILNITGLAATRDRIIFKSAGDALEQDFYPRDTSAEVQINPITWQVVSYSGISSVYTGRSNRVMYVDIRNA